MMYANRVHNKASTALTTVKRFLSRDNGSVAMEAAGIIPLFAIMMLVFAETSKGNHLSTQVGQTAATVSDIISQAESMSTAEIDGALAAGQAIAGTQAGGQIALSIIGVQVEKDGSNTTTKVKWSRSVNGGTTYVVDNPYPLPASLLTQSGFIIVSEASMDYTPAVGHSITGSIPLGAKNYFIPRVGFETNCSDC